MFCWLVCGIQNSHQKRSSVVRTPWHERMEVARSGSWAPDSVKWLWLWDEKIICSYEIGQRNIQCERFSPDSKNALG